MKRLPSPADLAAGSASKKVAKACAFLSSRATDLHEYESLDDLAYALASDPPPSELKGVDHNLAVVRDAVLKTLRTRSVFVGSSVVEELVFEAFRSTPDDPVEHVFHVIRDAGVDEPGLVIFPLHSAGILGYGLGRAFARFGHAELEVEFVVQTAGIVFSPQTNSERATLRLLRRVGRHLRLKRAIPEDSLRHHMRIPATAWLTRNPLLFVKTHVFSGTAYENQRFLLLKLRMATSLLLFLASLERGIRGRKPSASTSSRSINNWQTLDIHHYLVYQASGAEVSNFAGQRIPMNVDPAELAEVSGIGINFNPAAWKRRPRVSKRLIAALKTVEEGYLKHELVNSDTSARARVYRKLVDSLGYFRRSFRPLSRYEDRCVQLAIAFETLLTDSYGAPRDTISRRATLALNKVPNAVHLQRAARRLYEARNEIVHTGNAHVRTDLRLAQTAFTYCFVAIVRNIARVPAQCAAPIATILRDTSRSAGK